MHLSIRIRVARSEMGWSQSMLAEQLKVHRSAVGHWERGDGSVPSAKRLLDLAKLTGVNVEWLTTGNGPIKSGSGAVTASSLVALSEGEAQLLRRFRLLTAREQAQLLELAKRWTHSLLESLL